MAARGAGARPKDGEADAGTERRTPMPAACRRARNPSGLARHAGRLAHVWAYRGADGRGRQNDKRARLRDVLDGILRERADANGRAVLTNAVNIGFGTKEMRAGVSRPIRTQKSPALAGARWPAGRSAPSTPGHHSASGA